jgi:hypothetical protein
MPVVANVDIDIGTAFVIVFARCGWMAWIHKSDRDIPMPFSAKIAAAWLRVPFSL